jgi:hypothetical protein
MTCEGAHPRPLAMKKKKKKKTVVATGEGSV